MIDVRIQAADFDPGRQLARLGDLKKRALFSFTAIAPAPDGVEAIWIDHYPPLARAELTRFATEAQARWNTCGIVLVHRHGRLAPCDRLAFAGVAADAADPANEALAFLIDKLRTEAPFWRKDLLPGGEGEWRG